VKEFLLHSSASSSQSSQSQSQSPNQVIMFQLTLGAIVQFLLFSLAAAAPMATESRHGNAWQYGAGGGVIGFIVLILDIIVFSKFDFAYTLFERENDRVLTALLYSGSFAVQPYRLEQGLVVLACLPLPHRWYDHLLALLQPCWSPIRRIRADCVNNLLSTDNQSAEISHQTQSIKRIHGIRTRRSSESRNGSYYVNGSGM
jgi:hypothetical protein